MRVMTVTRLFPSSVQPTLGTFILERMNAVRSLGVDVEVVAPLCYVPPGPVPRRFRDFRRVPREEVYKGFRVHHPRYPVIPKIGTRWQGAGYARAIRSVIARAKPDLLDVHYLFPDACGAARVAQELDIPFVVSARGSDVKYFAHLPMPRRQIRAALAGAGAVVAVSEDLASDMRRFELADHVEVIPNGADLERFSPRPKADACRALGIDATRPRIVCVGHLVDEHRQALCIEALSREPSPRDLELALVGGGADEPMLRALAERLGLSDRIRFVGPVPHDAVPTWFHAADASVLMSEREGCPNVVIESLACGVPCLATDLPGDARAHRS